MSDTIAYTVHDDIAVLCIQNPPVNALSQAVRQGLMAGLDRAEAAPEIRAVILVGDGRAFIAGADIKEFGKTPQEPHLPDLCNRIEASPLLVVASMHGVSLGGGLEVALAAHYRVAQPTARVGLPEVHLGLIPGAGGTQRLPRLTGAQKAIDIITSGRHLPAQEAADLGIIDHIEEGDPREVGLAYTRALLRDGAAPRPVSGLPAAAPIDWDTTYAKVLRKGRGQLSPAQAVRVVQASAELSFADGLAAERAMFQDLMQTDQRQGMIHAFFSERAVSALPELEGVDPRTIKQIGVIGGGTMGAGIATSALLAGLRVVLVEQTQSAAEAALKRLSDMLGGALKRGKLTQARYDKALTEHLDVVTEYDALADADVVIEAVFEDMDVKTAVFAALDDVCKPGAVLATNTSYLDIDALAAQTARPQDIIGLHFFSPAHVMKLLEVVVPAQATPDVVATGFALGKKLGKVAVRSGVCDGFIGNRIMRAYRTAADHMVLDGATPFEIDAAIAGFGFALGPFAVSDLAGLDIAWAMRKRLAPTRDPRARVGRYPDKLCEAGQFGRKTGTGFYLYEGGGAGVPNPEVMAFVTAERTERGITPRSFTPEEIQRRYMAAMVNEAARIVGEGIAGRPLDVDVVLIAGYGFPRYHGGPLKWADMQGLPTVLADIEGFAQEDNYFWQPAPLLQQLVQDKRCFEDLNRAP